MEQYDASLASLCNAITVFQQANPNHTIDMAWLSPDIRNRVEAAQKSDAVVIAHQLITQGAEKPAATRLLQTVFTTLQNDGKSPKPYYWPLQKLPDGTEGDEQKDKDKQQAIKPKPDLSNEEIHDGYRELAESLQKSLNALSHIEDVATLNTALLGLLKQHLWCIPGTLPDVSLYDEARVAGALAACISQHPPDAPDNTIALLVEGDISGIQRFIYTVTAKGASKILRARSLYLQLLTEAAARLLLRQANMPDTNLIYVGGGRFYLILPIGSDHTLQETREQLDDMLLKHHDGSLYLALGSTVLTASDFQPSQFQNKWRDVTQATSKDKRQRFAQFEAQDLLEQVFEPRDVTDGSEIALRYAERGDITQIEDFSISQFTTSLEELGQKLPKAAYLVLGETTASPKNAGTFQTALAELGMTFALLDADGESLIKPAKRDAERLVVLGMRAMPSMDILSKAAAIYDDCPKAGDIRFTVNVVPKRSHNETATFNDLQQASIGVKRLGVLRMDVDNLGQLFVSGFKQGKESRASLVRVASLSFALSLFFEGQIDTICREFNKNHTRNDVPNRNDDASGQLLQKVQTIYTVYSGGDDLFIVGTWDVMPELAQRISDDFATFTQNRALCHISGGLTLHGGKYPLYQAADDAEHALDSAKEMDGKDAMTFLSQSTKWQQWPNITQSVDNLAFLVGQEKIGRSLLQTIQQFYADYRAAPRQTNRSANEQVVWGPFVWRSAYQFARIADRAGDTHKNEIDELYEQIKANGFRGLETVGLAARWAEALTRKDKQEK